MVVSSLKKYVGRGSKRSSGGGGSYVSDVPYGPSFDGDATYAPSKNVFWDVIQGIGYVVGNIAYVNATGGNDSNAVLGNQLKPFQSIGAAINALGTLPFSAIYIAAGSYWLTDGNAPMGLKAAGSKYDVYLAFGASILYSGTYGVWIANQSAGTIGNLFGQGTITTDSTFFTGSVEGVDGYAFNYSILSTPVFVQAYDLKSEATSDVANLMRIGTCSGTGINIDISGRLQSRGGWVLNADTNSRTQIIKLNYIANTSQNFGLMKITNPASFLADYIVNSDAYGNYLGKSQLEGIQINISNPGSLIKFTNCFIRATETTNAAYKLISITATTTDLSNVTFDRCRFKNRQNTAYSVAGYSIFTNTDISLKIIDSYAESPSGGTGAITNLISTGNGFMVDPNL